ncbi:MAG: glycosyl hydrolase [Crocinitomicaceae bacterium]
MKVFYLALSIALLVTISCKKVKFNELPASEITDYDPINATKKQDILNYLTEIGESDSLIAGQMIGMGNLGDPNYAPEDFTGLNKKPGVLGVDLGWFTDFSQLEPNFVENIIQQESEGSLITISMHMPNPFNRKEGADKYHKKRFDYSEVYTEGTATNERFKVLLNNAANVLQELKNDNVIVLWRPFHEMNGGFFWWGSDKKFPEQEEFKELWIYTYNYLEVERQLDNLLWVYGPNYQYDNILKPTDYYYPGDEYVDVVGLDYYANDLSDINMNNSMSNLMAYNKPICIAEIGKGVNQEVAMNETDNLIYLGLKEYPVAYFLVWNSWPNHYGSIIDSKNADELMNHELIISQDEVSY